MLTARDEEPDRVAGLELGADDYVSKPFSPRELSARIKAILRRAERSSEDEVLTAREVVLRRDAREVTVAGEQVELTSKEFDLLACFLEHPGIVLSRERLLDLVWGMTYPGGTRTVDVHVAQLRRKLGDHEGSGRFAAPAPSSSLPDMRGGGLRSQLFRAIGLVVLICVALTIGLGVVLTRRAVEKATLKDLSHQAVLIAGTQVTGLGSTASLAKLRPYFKQQDEQVSNNALILPTSAQTRLAQGRGRRER
jgi:hypothetical protein